MPAHTRSMALGAMPKLFNMPVDIQGRSADISENASEHSVDIQWTSVNMPVDIQGTFSGHQ
jgi:hypothetical protein